MTCPYHSESSFPSLHRSLHPQPQLLFAYSVQQGHLLAESRKFVNLLPDKNIPEGKLSSQNNRKWACLGCVIRGSIVFRGPSSGQGPSAFLIALKPKACPAWKLSSSLKTEDAPRPRLYLGNIFNLKVVSRVIY